MGDEYIKALKVYKYFTLKGVKRLCEKYPNLRHVKIALKMKQERMKDESICR
ncbi:MULTISPECIES: hypothetical protein [Campylobacter]|uniref:hypothetical protein n=1 Tax=Campylobacter TaxID=194 RepID=UPI0014707ACF|nr:MULTISPECIES: hypothetical protein [Campylobacter]MBN7287568.1 hypothetical protein [Campylobacter curvus]MDU6826565.1 hypothetical protein [Campylobacter sp.]